MLQPELKMRRDKIRVLMAQQNIYAFVRLVSPFVFS